MFFLGGKRQPHNAATKFKYRGTYCSVLHKFETGAKVCQANVAVHVQQDVVRLDVPFRHKKQNNKVLYFFAYQPSETLLCNKENSSGFMIEM